MNSFSDARRESMVHDLEIFWKDPAPFQKSTEHTIVNSLSAEEMKSMLIDSINTDKEVVVIGDLLIPKNKFLMINIKKSQTFEQKMDFYNAMMRRNKDE